MIQQFHSLVYIWEKIWFEKAMGNCKFWGLKKEHSRLFELWC